MSTIFAYPTDSLASKGIVISVEEKANKCFVVDVKFITNGSLTVVIAISSGETLKIHYIFSSKYVAFDGKSNIFYGLGDRRPEWIHLARDLKVDLLKGLLTKFKMDAIKNGFSLTKIVEFRLHGHGWLDNLTLSRSIHMDQFYSAADWLVRHQDNRGGWPVMVRRVLTGFPELPPGWYSAMGQGQAMSVLVRAYLDSNSKKYLDAAVKALQLFQIDSVNGGVRARFFGKYDWYEEYPTTPGSFVLNGFIYSLLGLYDLKETATGENQVLAESIYNSGMTSLKNMLPMYDSGSGTFYDLRHITISTQPNRARWDYHTTHINQILQLMIIDDDDIFKSTAQRWISYLKGKKSRHN